MIRKYIYKAYCHAISTLHHRQRAARLAGVKETTLYAYVSRGLIRSEAVSDTPRQHLYLAEDIQKLVQRKAQRRDPAKAARDALHWGTPMLDSDLTLITEHRLYYRGYDAARLAREHSLEEVAALLWTGDMDDAATLFTTRPLLTGVVQTVMDMHLPPLQGVQVALALAAAQDLSAYDLRPAAVLQPGRVSSGCWRQLRRSARRSLPPSPLRWHRPGIPTARPC